MRLVYFDFCLESEIREYKTLALRGFCTQSKSSVNIYIMKKKKRLYRSQNDRIIAGVASGFAEYFDMDPAIMRIIFILVILASGGGGLLAYIILIFIIPRDPNS